MMLGNPNSTYNTTVLVFEQVPGSFAGAPVTSGAVYNIRLGGGSCRVNKVCGGCMPVAACGLLRAVPTSVAAWISFPALPTMPPS
jgi:hypothetical protein